MSKNRVFSPSGQFWTIFGQFFDIFRTFCRHTLFWAVQRFARYNTWEPNQQSNRLKALLRGTCYLSTVKEVVRVRRDFSEKVFVSQERVSGFPGSLGNFRGSLGNFRGTSGLLLSSTVRELPGKSPKTSGEVRGTSGEVRGLARSSGEPDSHQRPAKFVSKLLT